MKSFTTSSGHSGECQNPLCNAPLDPIKDGWRRTERRYCNDVCKLNAWLIRKVAGLFRHVQSSTILQIMEGDGMKTADNGQSIDVCDICQQRALVRNLADDHDHANGRWRGKLCGRCNMGLGHFKDDPVRLRRAAEYVDYWRMAHADPPGIDCEFQEYTDRTKAG